jgi:uncharacterized protein with HEPN domain
MLKSDLTRLHHILDAAKEAIELIQDISRQDLKFNRTLCLSLFYLIANMGEASNAISKTFRSSHSEIPWRKMIGMRNRLIHGYFDVNLDIVWETINGDLPQLIIQIERVLALDDNNTLLEFGR